MGLHQNTAEGQTSGTVLSAANSGAGSGTAFDSVNPVGSPTCTFDNAQAMHGSQSYHLVITTTTDTYDFRWTASISTNGLALRFYVRFNALPSVAMDLVTVRNSGGNVAKWQITAANKLFAADASGGGNTFATVLSTGTWYRCESETTVGTTTANGTAHAAYYLGDSGTAQDTVWAPGATRNTGTTPITSVRFGKQTASGTIACWFDDIAIDDTTTTPLGPTVSIASGTGSIALASTANVAPSTAAGALSLGAAGVEVSSASGALSLGAAATPVMPAAAALTLGAAATRGPSTAVGSLTLGASVTTYATGSGSLTLGAAGTPSPAAATGTISLSGVATIAPRAATGAMTLLGLANATLTASGTGSLTLGATGAAAAAGWIGTTLDETATPTTTRAVTLPAGSVAGGFAVALMASASSTPITLSAPGTWSTVVDAPANNMYVIGILKQLTAGEISAGTITFTTLSANNPIWLSTFDGTYLAVDGSVSLPVTPGTRGGVSQTFVAAPAVTPTGASAGVIFSLERTTATGTVVSSMTYGTVDYDVEANVTANVSLLIGHCPLTAGVSSGVDTITYSGASGNALAFILPMTIAGPAAAVIRAATATLGLGVVEAVIRAATAVLFSPQQVWTRTAGAWVAGKPNYIQTANPFDTVTLPAGTWTQTSGPTVTITAGAFTAPALEAGAVLVFTSGSNTDTVTIAPHNFFVYTASTLKGVRPIRL